MADCIGDVFTRARRIAPCVLVLEDIDGLFDPEGLAFFLNELDGFAENAGIVTLGTTNHPDRLDPALLDRPSRFDRTYAFDLPGVDERRRYLELRNERLVAEQRLSAEVIRELSEATDGFSFAYMKELVLGALLSSIDGPLDLAPALRAGLARLREQLGRAREITAGRIYPSDT
jgi:AAA+ superfamily predicted ATPase